LRCGAEVKKVLFIAYLYPPIANSGTQRSVKFANYLPDYGWEPIVLTVENPPETTIEPALLEEVRSGTRVERVSFWSDELAKRIANIFCTVKRRSWMFEGLRWRIRCIWTIPDHWALWKPTVVRRAFEIYQSEGFDCIYASGCPWTSFLIARDIAKLTGKPYVLDYRDLWSGWSSMWDESSRLTRWLSGWQELMVLKRASAIITVSESLVKVLADMLPPSDRSRVTCIANGYDKSDFMIVPMVMDTTEKLRLVYTGVWKAGYTLDVLYEALRIMKINFPNAPNKLEVICAGFPPGPVKKYDIEDIVQEIGRVSHGEAISLMKSADVLFLNVPEGEYACWSLPGKLFEYLGSGKPIIAVVPAESEVAQVLNRIGGAMRLDPGDVNGLAKVLVDIAQAGGPTWGSPDPSLTACFERRNLTSQLAEVLSSVSKTQ